MNTDKTIKEENARIPVRVQTQKRMRDFANGVGVTYDDAINLLLDYVSKPDESPVVSGDRFRREQLEEKAQ